GGATAAARLPVGRFFFSSRRRHTRFSRDWSSDVCSSDLMYHSLDAMQSVLVRYRLAGYPPDVLITVPRDACRSLEFHRAEEMIALGRELAERELDKAGL